MSIDSPVIGIILNWNGYENTENCLISLSGDDKSRLKIVVVDNGSTDDSVSRIRQKFPDITLLALKENLGYAGGNNAGIRYALKEFPKYILILNNDIVVDEGFLEALVRVADQDPSIGIVAPKVCYFDKRDVIYSAGGCFSKLLCSGVGIMQGIKEGTVEQRPEQCQDISFAPGCALLIRTEVFNALGLFDERFFMYFEDVEFSQRVQKEYRIVYVPGSRVYHKVGAGVGWASYTPLYSYYYTRNRLWYGKNISAIYGAYVVVLSLANVLAKSFIVLLKNPSNRLSTAKQLRGLWKGLWDGVFCKGL